MREVNFSIPNANKASVGITPALYDRRALDCTSTLPLINSLNNLAYHATSSARIRDILTVDGGIERLICILKEGRKTKNMMECWKWNLAFQCVVNIGIRGSEAVRTRVVEADMVPVIATMLENYIRGIDKAREKCEADSKKSIRHLGSSSKHHTRTSDLLFPGTAGIRRQAPPRIEIPRRSVLPGAENQGPGAPQNVPAFSLSSPPERTTFNHRSHHHHHHHHHRNHDTQPSGPLPAQTSHNILAQPLPASITQVEATQDSFDIRPVPEADRLPSVVPIPQAELTSQPVSPTTPSAPMQSHNQMPRAPTEPARPTRRPSIRHQLSVSGVPDDVISPDELSTDASAEVGIAEPMVGIQADMAMQDIVDPDTLLGGVGSPMRLEQQPSDTTADTVNMARSALESGSITNAMNVTPNLPPANFNMPQPQAHTMTPTVQMQLNPYARYVQDCCAAAGFASSMPRDEDVLMCLQLLAYVSKYCNLRSYFQQSHLVPKLKIPTWELDFLDGDMSSHREPAVEEEHIDEYLQADDFNIFPLVEKFTVRHHTHDMQYWAGVVMRNLCRKDDARGGIRQCAYYQCGRWEEYPRQFAKCRRCRRTKYCSKECQKSAWVFHRHWCVPAQEPSRS